MCIMVDLKIVNRQSAGRVKLSGDFLSKFMTSRRNFFFSKSHPCVFWICIRISMEAVSVASFVTLVYSISFSQCGDCALMK